MVTVSRSSLLSTHSSISMPGQLLTQYFLTDGIRQTQAWQGSLAQPDRLDAFRAAADDLFNKVSAYQNPNEAATEQDLIRPLLRPPRLDRLPAPAGQRTQRGHSRPSALRRRRRQDPRRRQRQHGPLRRRLGGRRKQTFRPLSWTPATATNAAEPVHRTTSSFATSPPPTSVPTGASAGASSPMAASGASTIAAPAPAPAASTR